MRKYVVFNEEIRDESTGVVWRPGVKYGVTFENESVYCLGTNAGKRVGISKELENEVFSVHTLIPLNY